MFKLPTLDLSSVRFGEPAYLWLLAGSAALLVVWVWRVVRRRRDVRQMRHGRILPKTWAGEPGWYAFILHPLTPRYP